MDEAVQLFLRRAVSPCIQEQYVWQAPSADGAMYQELVDYSSCIGKQ